MKHKITIYIQVSMIHKKNQKLIKKSLNIYVYALRACSVPICNIILSIMCP